MKNFFEHQDVARRNTVRLIVLFGLAVLLTIVAVYVVIIIGFYGGTSNFQGVDSILFWWHPQAFLMASVGTLLLVGGGTAWKIRQLARGGGSYVCEQLGGTFIDFRTDDLDEQVLINIVEEMSIASGVSVPLLYVLDNEPGINAFAAGFSPNNAAIAVSRGCLEMLNRDELQGVVAHEFAHILNGDMRMNIRMIGVLHGILMLALAGRVIMRAAASGGRRRSSRNSGNGALYLLAVGLALFIIGYVGRFFGQMIKSAISRQREYLADAAAVQFTRNPKGIAGALKKIGGYSYGSAIDSSNADEVSHLFFGNALSGSSWINSLFATHPPLKKRIRRIDPEFHGAFPKFEEREQLPAPETKRRSGRYEVAGAAGLAGAAAMANDGGSGRARSGQHIKANADDVMNSLGQTSEEHVAYARTVLDAIPEQIHEAAHDTYSAAGVVFALLLDPDMSTRQVQLDILEAELTAPMAKETHHYMELLEDLDPRHRLPLVEILVPALRQMSDKHHEQFVIILDKLIMADDHVTLFEFALEKLLKHRLKSESGRRVAQFYSIHPLREDIKLLLSHLAYAGHDQTSEAVLAFNAGTAHIKNGKVRNKLDLMGRGNCSLEQLDRALDRIALTTNAIKQQIVDAATHCALADGEVTVEEGELLRAICEVIDVPLPPFLGSEG
jgi:Zn-dependent protease with chaperone function